MRDMAARKWTSTLITKTIRSLYREGADLSYNAMCRKQQALVSASNYYFGSYRKAVDAAGIDYAEIQRKPYWNAARVIAVIRKYDRKGTDLSWAKVTHRRDELFCAAKAAVRERIFGNWPEALAAAGLEPDEVSRYRHWDRPRIIKQLRQRAKARQGLNSKAIQVELPGLYGATTRVFGSFENALVAARLDPAEIRQRREWDARTVLAALREFEKRHRMVSQGLLRKHDCGLLRAVRVFCGDLPTAMKKAGVKRFRIRAKAGRPRK